MVVPELLASLAYVSDTVRCKIIDPKAIFLTGLLGESGRKLVKAGLSSISLKHLPSKCEIEAGIAGSSPAINQIYFK